MGDKVGLWVTLLLTLSAPIRAQPASTATAQIALSSRTVAVSISTASVATPPKPTVPPKPDLVGQFRRADDPKTKVDILQQMILPANHDIGSRLLLSHVVLEDFNDKVRTAAGTALLSYGGDEPVRTIENALAAEQGEGVRKSLCLALSSSAAHADDAMATEALAQLVTQDPSGNVRLCAVEALEKRGDRRALPVLNAAAEHDDVPMVRKAAKKAFAALFAPPKTKSKPEAAPKAKPLETVDETGHLHCGSDAGVCQCTNGVITPRPHCLVLEDCRHLYETSYQNEGNFGCTWDGQDVEQQR